MDDWKGVIAAIEFMLQYREIPKNDVVMLAKAIRKGDAIVFSPEEIIEALKQAIDSEDDLSDLIPQKHSNEVLRETFDLLLKELETA